jgi:hypothetical protein
MASSRWIATSEFTTSIGPANQAAEQILNARREKLLGKTKRIFDPKFTARGSGFPAVLGIVKGHRSDIEFQTQQEIGTTFEIFLSASERPVAAQPEPNLAPVVRRTGPNILVVDDDQSPIVFRSFCQTCGNTSISGRHSPGARFAPQRRPRDKPPPRSILRKLPPEFRDLFMRWRPIRVARIAVEHQRARFQSRFEFLLAECNRLVVVVRANDFEINAIAHNAS